MTNLQDIPKNLHEIELKEEGSTMERFASLTRRLLKVSRDDVKKAEEEFRSRKPSI
jgi:hypothetical protein